MRRRNRSSWPATAAMPTPRSPRIAARRNVTGFCTGRRPPS